MPAGQGDLLLDEVVVVQQPGFRLHDGLPAGCRGGDYLVGLRKNAFILVQAREQPALARTPGDTMGARQGHGIVLQLFAAEEFRAQQAQILVIVHRVRLSR